jgi:NADH dehydrogenase (ubiquinone) Fe-S protein 8
MAPALAATTAMLTRRQLPRATASASLVAARTYATPSGPPPPGFRTSKPVEFTWDRDNTPDRLGKTFLMTEMARGMWLLMEQYFRPPYAQRPPRNLDNLREICHGY